MAAYTWGGGLDGLFFCLLFLPYLPLLILVFVFVFIFAPVDILYTFVQKIFGLCGVNLKIKALDWISHINDPSPKCRKSKKSFVSTAWYYIKHPSSIQNILKQNIELLLKKSKFDKLSYQLCFENCKQSLKNETKAKERKKILGSESNWKVYIMVYYSLLLTTYYWSRAAIFYASDGKDTPDNWIFFGIIITFYFTALVKLYIMMLGINRIPMANHMTKKSAVQLLSSLKLNSKLNIRCYHEESLGSGDATTTITVTTYAAKIEVPVKEWVDNEQYNYEDVSNEIQNILKEHLFFIARACLDCKPTNIETEKAMQEFRQHHINQNKHMDKYTEANFLFKAMKENNEVVEEIVVHRDDCDVPNYWLAPLFPYTSLVLLLLGLALPVMLVLLLKRNVKRMVLAKNFEISSEHV